MQVSAASLAQRITLNHKKVSLEKVFREIHNQTGYDFLYDKELLDKKERITISANNEPLENVLARCLKNLSLSYAIEDKMIVIKDKQENIFNKIITAFQTMDVTGKVLNERGLPLAGASIKEKTTGKTTTSDALGNFTLSGIREGSSLEITYIGYVTKVIKASSEMTIQMAIATSELNEVVVNKGYYSEKEKLSTGNSVTITAKDIEKQPVLNPMLALQGRVAGLQITQTSGVTNGSLNILIRGRSSLNDVVGNNPLFIIDGVPYQSLLLSDPLGNNGGNGIVASSPQGNPLNYINPNDVESITILKDADATAIYGSRGGNGVILITTKKGQAGNMTLNANVSQGYMQAPEKLTLMNTQQYLDMRREAFRNDGLPVPNMNTSPGDPNYDVNGTWSQTQNTDWQKTLIGNSNAYTNINLSLTGGSELVRYAVRGTFNRQGNLYPGDFDDKRGGINFNITASTKNQKLKIDFSGNLLRDNNQNAQTDLTAYTLRAPNAPDSFNPDGTLNFGGVNSDNSNNPFAYTLRSYGNMTDNQVLSLKPTYQIIDGLVATANIGLTNLNTDIKIKQPLSSYSPQYLSLLSPSSVNALINTLNQQETWIIEPQLSYSRKISEVKIEALIGTTFQSSTNEGHAFVGQNFVSDAVIGNLSNAGTVVLQDNGTSTYKYNAIYSRVNFNLKDKYILNFTGRRDGSSKFGPGKQFGNFYSGAAAWVFSSEKFVANSLAFLSLGKLRASYGTSGNDNISNYSYYDLYQSRGTNTYQGMVGFYPRSVSNPNVAWEKNAKLELGLDLAFFNDRISLSGVYYRNRSSNQLLFYTVPSFIGFSSIPNYNFPATVQNSGLEFSISTSNVKGKDFQWSSAFNISINHNKLIAFDNLENTSYANRLAIGEPVIGRTQAWIYTGVDPQTGLYTTLKTDGTVGSDAGNGVYSGGAYQTTFINTAPKFFGGFNNVFRYKNLQLDLFLQFVKQTGRLSLADYAPGYFSTSLYDQLFTVGSNVSTTFLDRWQKPGDPATYQRFTQSAAGITAYGSWAYSDASYVDASFIRAKNVTLSYQLPQTLKSKLGLRNAAINLSGQNLFTITPYKGRDPETQGYGTLPPLKVFVLGLQITL